MLRKIGEASAIAAYRKKVRKELDKIIRKYREKKEAWQYTEVALTLFIVAFFSFFAVKPAAVTVSGLVGKIREKEEISVKMQKKINDLIEAQQIYSVAQTRVSLVDSFLPDDLGIAQGISQLVGSAQDSSLSLRGLGFSRVNLSGSEEKNKKAKAVQKDQNLKTLAFNFSGKGDYFDIRSFIDQLTRVRRWIAINQYQISKDKKDKKEEERVLNLTLAGELNYWQSGW